MRYSVTRVIRDGRLMTSLHFRNVAALQTRPSGDSGDDRATMSLGSERDVGVCGDGCIPGRSADEKLNSSQIIPIESY